MLGIRLSAASLQTGDIDIAQFKDVSVAIGDSTPPMLETLKQVDKTFRAIPSHRRRQAGDKAMRPKRELVSIF